LEYHSTRWEIFVSLGTAAFFIGQLILEVVSGNRPHNDNLVFLSGMTVALLIYLFVLYVRNARGEHTWIEVYFGALIPGWAYWWLQEMGMPSAHPVLLGAIGIAQLGLVIWLSRFFRS